MANADTIVAIATPPGRGGIGVVRISGVGLEDVFPRIFGGKVRPRFATLRNFIDRHGEVFERGIVIFYPAPHSYTGEDVIELQGHGGPAVLREILEQCLNLGARVAQPGEFTKRAFLNNKIDLAQAEAVADLIDANTSRAARCAQRSLRGDFSNAIRELSEGLIKQRAKLEAILNFPDEDVEDETSSTLVAELGRMEERLLAVERASQQGNLLREGAKVVLIGEPNVGKSSLLNTLAGDDLAIVTETPGTTRDPIRQHLELDGVPFSIVDTAGLREAQDSVEQEGIARTWREVNDADVAIIVIDCAHIDRGYPRELLKQLPGNLPLLFVYNKIDLIGKAPATDKGKNQTEIWLSAKTGAGIAQLKSALLEVLGWRGGADEGLFMARARHLSAIHQAKGHLFKAKRHHRQLELVAEDLRLAQDALRVITGEYTADDLLGEIFSRFCIGK
jgi:tRNA modification GTPase